MKLCKFKFPLMRVLIHHNKPYATKSYKKIIYAIAKNMGMGQLYMIKDIQKNKGKVEASGLVSYSGFFWGFFFFIFQFFIGIVAHFVS